MKTHAQRARTLAWCVLLSGCQTYDFQPVTPFTIAQHRQTKVNVTHGLKPNLMLLVDRSGSMGEPLDAGCSHGCDTRLSELKSAMDGFLPGAGDLARLGLTVFPAEGGACAGSTPASTLVSLPAPTLTDDGTAGVLAQSAAQVAQAIRGLEANGGTPTGSSLAYLSTLAGLTDATDHRDDYVLLLTDGLPNCNPENPLSLCAGQTPASAAACACQAGNCAPGSLYCALGCLDSQGTVQTITSLRADQKLKTIVVGFGTSVTDGAAVQVLEAMGAAGGFERTCSSDADCGEADACASGRCGRHFFAASDGAQLTRALDAISVVILNPHPCVLPLEAQPADPALLSVLFDGVDLQPGPDTWSWSAATGAVTFAPASHWCAQLEASTDATTVTLEVRIVERL
jgi:hypothetical protein